MGGMRPDCLWCMRSQRYPGITVLRTHCCQPATACYSCYSTRSLQCYLAATRVPCHASPVSARHPPNLAPTPTPTWHQQPSSPPLPPYHTRQYHTIPCLAKTAKNVPADGQQLLEPVGSSSSRSSFLYICRRVCHVFWRRALFISSLDSSIIPCLEFLAVVVLWHHRHQLLLALLLLLRLLPYH